MYVCPKFPLVDKELMQEKLQITIYTQILAKKIKEKGTTRKKGNSLSSNYTIKSLKLLFLLVTTTT